MPSKDPETRRRQSTEASRRYRARHPERLKAYYKDYHQRKYPTLKRSYYYQNRYGLTIKEAEAMYAKGCAICGATEKMRIDHNHDSGVVRDALCDSCNQGIAKFGEDSNRLMAAAAYLIQHEAVFT